jgi:hypothetical protein
MRLLFVMHRLRRLFFVEKLEKENICKFEFLSFKNLTV